MTRAPACPVGRVVYGDRPCDGPGTYYCDSDLWGSACRRYFEAKEAMTPAPATVARCTTRDEEREGTE